MAKTILVVDDSATIRLLLAHVLESAGFQVVLSENGREALMRLAAHEVDAIMLDVKMPVMDGLVFLEKVRERPQHRSTPVLMMTTETRETRKSMARASGAAGWITKPFDPKEVLDVVARLLA